MANEFDISSFIDIPKLDAEFNKLDKRVKQSAKEIDALIGKMGAIGVGTDYSKEAARMAVAAARVETIKAESEKRQQKIVEDGVRKQEMFEIRKQKAMEQTARVRQATSMQERVDLQAVAAQEKLNAVVASEHATALQKLLAQMKLLEIDMQAKFNPALREQSQEFRNLNAQHKLLQSEYSRTAVATGVMSRQSTTATNSIFQFTQVLRELPNFAISSRVGFMALSNNLPMLVDGFKRLRQEIVDTQGAAGATGKTIATFAKSLLSVETVVLLVVTALLMYGDKIGELINRTTLAEKALDNFVKSLKTGGGEFSKAVKSFMEVSAIVDSATKGFISQKDAIEEYNKAFGKTNGEVKTFAELQNRIKEQTPAYVRAVAMMGLANSFLEEAIKKAGEAEASRQDTTVTFFDKAWYAMRKSALEGAKFLVNLLNIKTELKTVRDAIFGKGKDEKEDNGVLAKRIRDERKAEADALAAESNKAFEKYKQMYAKFAEFSQANKLDFWGDDSKGGSGGKSKTEKRLTEIANVQEFYDHARALAIAELAKLEEQTTKSTLDGELNAFDKRLEAAKNYYEISAQLYEIDAATAKKKANEKLEEELRANAKKYNDNVRKFGGKGAQKIDTSGDTASLKGSASSALAANAKLGISQLDMSGEQLKTGNATLESNNALAIQKIVDEMNQKILEQQQKFVRTKFQIDQDAYAEEVYALEQSLADKQKLIDQNAAREKMANNKKSFGEIFAESVGGKPKDRTQDNLFQDHLDAQQKYYNELNALKLKLVGASGEQELALQKKISETQKAQLNEDRDYRIKAEQEAQNKLQEIQEENTKTLISNIKDMWQLYFDFLNEKIDENLKKQTGVNEEKVKQYEDETKAGKHTEQELSDFKDRMSVYQQSQEEEAVRKKQENERNAFMLSQAMAIGNIWLQYSQAQAAILMASQLLGPVLSPGYIALMSGLNLTTAITGTALAAAQTIPYFKDGTESSPEGVAMLGDGGKKELAVMPSGKWFVTPDVPTPYYLEQGTKIYPDVNKLDMQSFLAVSQTRGKGVDMAIVEWELKQINRNFAKQRPAQLNGMPLIKQMQNTQRYSYRKRGLLN